MLDHICMIFRSDRHNIGQFFSSGRCSHGNDRQKLIVSDIFESEVS